METQVMLPWVAQVATSSCSSRFANLIVFFEPASIASAKRLSSRHPLPIQFVSSLAKNSLVLSKSKRYQHLLRVPTVWATFPGGNLSRIGCFSLQLLLRQCHPFIHRQ